MDNFLVVALVFALVILCFVAAAWSIGVVAREIRSLVTELVRMNGEIVADTVGLVADKVGAALRESVVAVVSGPVSDKGPGNPSDGYAEVTPWGDYYPDPTDSTIFAPAESSASRIAVLDEGENPFAGMGLTPPDLSGERL